MSAGDASAALVIGVDGGGSRCAAVLARPVPGGTGIDVIGRGRGGPANPRVAGHDTARASITAAIAAAFDDAGVAPATVDAACFGLAGVGLAADRDAVDAATARASAVRSYFAFHSCQRNLYSQPYTRCERKHECEPVRAHVRARVHGCVDFENPLVS